MLITSLSLLLLAGGGLIVLRVIRRGPLYLGLAYLGVATSEMPASMGVMERLLFRLTPGFAQLLCFLVGVILISELQVILGDYLDFSQKNHRLVSSLVGYPLGFALSVLASNHYKKRLDRMLEKHSISPEALLSQIAT